MEIRNIFLAALTAGMLAACHTTHDSGAPEHSVVESAGFTRFPTTVAEFSGMCYNQTKTAFMAVSDQGGIYEISFTGVTIRTLFVGGQDWEGITMDRATGTIYLVNERDYSVYKSLPPYSQVTKIATFQVTSDNNKALEGITYDGKGMLYIANQTNPLLIIKYDIATGQEVLPRINLSTTDFTYLSDISYDETDNTLWIVDSKTLLVTHCDLNGKIIGSRQRVGMAVSPEALLVDSPNKMIWIGSDATGDLYKIDLKV